MYMKQKSPKSILSLNPYLAVYNLDIPLYHFRLFFEVYFPGLNETTVIILEFLNFIVL